MATGDLASALAALQFAPTETPYGLAGATLAQSLPSLITPTTKPAQALGITLGGALIASLLGYQGQKQATQMGLEAAKQGARLAELPTATERAAYIESLPDVTGRTQIQNALLQYNQQLAGQDIFAKALANQEVAKQKALTEFELGPIGTELAKRKTQAAIDIAAAGRTPKEPKEPKDAWLLIPESQRNKISTAKGQIQELRNLATTFRELELSAGPYNVAKQVPGSKTDLAVSTMNTMVPSTARLFGEVGNLAQGEQERLIKATLGGRLSGTESVAKRLEALADIGTNIITNQLQTYQKAAESGLAGVLSDIQQTKTSPNVEQEKLKILKDIQAQIAAEKARRGIK